MKRVLTFLAIMLLPLSVMAMTPVTDSDLADVTGQAGVNINADLTMNIAIGTMAWGDADGIGALAAYGWDATTDGGYIGMTGFNITNLRIKARETDGFNGYTTAMLKPITIDVASDTEDVLYGGRTFVRFGLGSLQITMDAMSFNVALGASGATLDASTEVLGSVNLGALGIYINPTSYVDIYSHVGQGVNLTFSVTIDEFALNYISWGDDDGLVAGNTGDAVIWMAAGPAMGAGYVGLQDLSVGVIRIAGTVSIDVATSAAGIYAHGAPGTPTTVVHIGFGDGAGTPFLFAIDGPITANVRLDGTPGLDSVNAGELGDIYISGLAVTIADGSWVDIWAH